MAEVVKHDSQVYLVKVVTWLTNGASLTGVARRRYADVNNANVIPPIRFWYNDVLVHDSDIGRISEDGYTQKREWDNAIGEISTLIANTELTGDDNADKAILRQLGDEIEAVAVRKIAPIVVESAVLLDFVVDKIRALDTPS